MWQWANRWWCYWDGSFGMPRNPVDDFVFRGGLFETNSAVVIPGVRPNSTCGPFDTLRIPEAPTSALVGLCEVMHKASAWGSALEKFRVRSDTWCARVARGLCHRPCESRRACCPLVCGTCTGERYTAPLERARPCLSTEGADRAVRAVRRQPGAHNICSHQKLLKRGQ